MDRTKQPTGLDCSPLVLDICMSDIGFTSEWFVCVCSYRLQIKGILWFETKGLVLKQLQQNYKHRSINTLRCMHCNTTMQYCCSNRCKQAIYMDFVIWILLWLFTTQMVIYDMIARNTQATTIYIAPTIHPHLTSCYLRNAIVWQTKSMVVDSSSHLSTGPLIYQINLHSISTDCYIAFEHRTLYFIGEVSHNIHPFICSFLYSSICPSIDSLHPSDTRLSSLFMI